MPKDHRAQPSPAHPFPEAPKPGEVFEVAPGLLWLRFKLPFALNHVNVYLIEDGAGWAAVDTGIGDDLTREVWESLFAGPLKGRPLTRLILTHHHPDHMGSAGWLAEKFGIPVHMTETEYFMGRYLGTGHDAVHGDAHRIFYQNHGMTESGAAAVTGRGHMYLEMITGLPSSFHALEPREPFEVGGRTFQVHTGGGHSWNQAMLHCADENFFIAADQVLGRITPNISVHSVQPDGDPLGRYLDSLASLRAAIPDGTLTLPGHDLPITHLHQRIGELIAHHDERCDIVLNACRDKVLSCAEITPVLFTRQMDEHMFSFAFSETLAHVNRLLREGRLVDVGEPDEPRFRSA